MRNTATASLRHAVVTLLVFGAAGRADAHALGAEAKLKGGRVSIEAYYDDDTPAQNATVTVTDGEGKTVAEGKTDDRGVWSFAAPPAGKYRAVVDAGAGHRTTITLTIPAPPAPTSPSPSVEATAPPSPPTSRRTAPEPSGASEPVTVSDGPTRAEFTGSGRLVWVAVGLGVIAAAVGVWLATRGARRRGTANPPGQGDGPLDL